MLAFEDLSQKRGAKNNDRNEKNTNNNAPLDAGHHQLTMRDGEKSHIAGIKRPKTCEEKKRQDIQNTPKTPGPLRGMNCPLHLNATNAFNDKNCTQLDIKMHAIPHPTRVFPGSDYWALMQTSSSRVHTAVQRQQDKRLIKVLVCSVYVPVTYPTLA